MTMYTAKNITLREFVLNLFWYNGHIYNWYDVAHEDFLWGCYERWAKLTPNHTRLWDLYLDKENNPVRFWAAMAWAYGWKDITLERMEEILKDPTMKGGYLIEAFDKGVEAYEDTLYFEADVDAADAVDRDIENYCEELMIEEYENRNFVDTEAALLKTYWR